MSIFSRLFGRSNAGSPSELPIKGEGETSEAAEGILNIRHSQGLGALPAGDGAGPPSELPLKGEAGTSEASFMYFKDSPMVGEPQPVQAQTTEAQTEPAFNAFANFGDIKGEAEAPPSDPFEVKIDHVLPTQGDDAFAPTEGLSLIFEKTPLTYPNSADAAPTGDDVMVDGGDITGETPPAEYGDAGEQVYLAVELENVQGGPGTNNIAMEDTPGGADSAEAAGRIEMPKLSFHMPEGPAGGEEPGGPETGFKISDNDGSAAADSFGFGVEREMKESGEKGGTEAVNFRVGELQETSISKSMDPGGGDAPGADSSGFGVERAMKESGEKGGTEDINIGVGELQEATISKSMDAAPGGADDFSDGAGDVDGYRPIQILKRIDKNTPGATDDEDGSTLAALEVQEAAAIGQAIGGTAADDSSDDLDLDLDFDDDGDIEV